MKLIKIQCDNCKANLEVDKKSKFVKCKYCGSTTYIDDESININHLVKGEITEEQEFINAETRLNKFKAYDEAYKNYKTLSERYADNEEIWIGLLRSLTHDFTYVDKSNQFFKDECISYYNRYSSLVENNPYSKTYDEFMNSNNVEKTIYHSKNEKNYVIITCLLGYLGIHKFLKKETGMGLLYLFTFGLFGFGWIYDSVKECQKWQGTDQVKILKYILCFLIFTMFLAYIEEGFILSAILVAISFVITLPYTYNKINIKRKPIIAIICFILSLIISSAITEKNFKGKWVNEDSYLNFKDSNDVVFKLGGIEYKGEFTTSINEGTLKSDSETFNFKYKNNNELCYYKEDDKCIIIFKKDK